MKNIIALIIFIGLAICVYNCGYKGPLYLPNKPETSKPISSKPVSSSPWKITSTNESKIAESSNNRN